MWETCAPVCWTIALALFQHFLLDFASTLQVPTATSSFSFIWISAFLSHFPPAPSALWGLSGLAAGWVCNANGTLEMPLAPPCDLWTFLLCLSPHFLGFVSFPFEAHSAVPSWERFLECRFLVMLCAWTVFILPQHLISHSWVEWWIQPQDLFPFRMSPYPHLLGLQSRNLILACISFFTPLIFFSIWKFL